MSEMTIPGGPYIVWVYYGGDGWSWTNYATLEEALLAPKHMEHWVITRPVEFTINEKSATGCARCDAGIPRRLMRPDPREWVPPFPAPQWVHESVEGLIRCEAGNG